MLKFITNNIGKIIIGGIVAIITFGLINKAKH